MEELSAYILQTFPDGFPPARVVDVSPAYHFWKDAEDIFLGRKWTEVDCSAFMTHASAFGYLTARARAYYLPAVLQCCVTFPESFLAEQVISWLGESYALGSQVSELLTPLQRATVFKFICNERDQELALHGDDAFSRKAYDYWSTQV